MLGSRVGQFERDVLDSADLAVSGMAINSY